MWSVWENDMYDFSCTCPKRDLFRLKNAYEFNFDFDLRIFVWYIHIKNEIMYFLDQIILIILIIIILFNLNKNIISFFIWMYKTDIRNL